jgi:anti-sigma regulatory factor (Ser/Thr protein kinase)
VTAVLRTDRFEHEAMFYRGDGDFLAGLLPYVRDGLDADEAVVVAEPRPRLELLRDALGDDAGDVEFLDMAEIGANPARIIPVWRAVLDRHTGEGRRLRGVGEPVYVGRRAAELVECRLHELLLNHAFDDGPGWRLLCPYDQEHLPRAVTQAALRTHPVRSTSDSRRPSLGYAPGGHRDGFAERLPAPGDAVLRGRFGPADVPATRRTVAHWARSCGLPEDQVEVLELAASELATNSIRHGGGSGTVAMWLDGSAAVVEFSDAGVLTDPMSGRRTPTLEQEGGHNREIGLYLVNQLCDLVQLRSSDRGTTVRITTWF